MDVPDGAEGTATGVGAAPTDAGREFNFDSGLPADKRLSDLSEMEGTIFCEFAQNLWTQLNEVVSGVRIQCTYGALAMPGVVDGMTVNREACEKAVNACVSAAPESAPVVQLFDCTAQTVAQLVDCDLTVSVVQSCLAAATGPTRAQFGLVDCKVLSRGGRDAGPKPAGSELPAFTQPGEFAECKSVAQQCPMLISLP